MKEGDLVRSRRYGWVGMILRFAPVDMGVATVQWLGDSPAAGKQIDKCHIIMLEALDASEAAEAAEVYQKKDEDDEA